MKKEYNHIQIGYFLLFVAFSLVILYLRTNVISLPIMISGISLILLFCTMTTSVDEEKLTIKIGVGLLRKKILLKDIAFSQKVKTLQIYGLGVRYIKGGKMYRIGGTSSVEIILHNGTRIVVGTDDPDGLIKSISHFQKTTIS